MGPEMGEELPGVPQGAWNLRRRSLEVARERILTLEERFETTAAAEPSEDGARMDRTVSRWQKVEDRSGEDAAGSPEYWVNRVTDEVRSEKPSPAEEAADVAERADKIKQRLRLTTSKLVCSDGKHDSPAAPRGSVTPKDRWSMAGLVLAKKQAAKRRAIASSKFKIQTGRIERTSAKTLGLNRSGVTSDAGVPAKENASPPGSCGGAGSFFLDGRGRFGIVGVVVSNNRICGLANFELD